MEFAYALKPRTLAAQGQKCSCRTELSEWRYFAIASANLIDDGLRLQIEGKSQYRVTQELQNERHDVLVNCCERQ